MTLEQFKDKAKVEDRNKRSEFGGLEIEISTLSSFKIVKKTYFYTDKSNQTFQFFFFEDQEVKEAEFLTHLTNYKD